MSTRISRCCSSSLGTVDLDKVCAAANQVLVKENVAGWNLKAFKYYYIPVPPNGIAGIVVEFTEDLLRLQQELLEAVAPFTEKGGTAAAFVSADGGRDIQQGLIDYVANFTTVAAGGLSSTRMSPLVSLRKPTLRRCSRNRSKRSRSRLRARPSTNSAVLGQLARSFRRYR